MLDSIFEPSEVAFQWREEKREEQYRNYTLVQEKKVIVVTSRGWVSKDGNACMRFARFQNEQIDITTLIIFPTNDTSLFPIFVVELVLVMDKIHRCIVDVEPVTLLSKPLIDTYFSSLYTKNQDLLEQLNDRPDWFTDIQSPYAIYATCNASEVHKVETIVDSYFSMFMLEYINGQKLPVFEQVKDHVSVAEYKKHHVAHSPAKSIIKGENESWLNQFLEHNHFKIL